MYTAPNEKTKLYTESFCPQTLTYVRGQPLTWYKTTAGQMGISNEICADSNGWVRRLCKLDRRTGKAEWSTVWKRCFSRYLTPGLTRNLYEIYRDSYETGQNVNVSDLRKVWKKNVDFRSIDLEILVSTFNYLPKNLPSSDVSYLLNIVVDALNKDVLDTNRCYNQICMGFVSIFERLLTSYKEGDGSGFEITTPNLFLTIFYPFARNTVGFVFRKNSYENLLNVSEIFHDNFDFHQSNMQNLELAAYFPLDFLENLARNYNLTTVQRQDFRIVMVFAKNSPIYMDYFESKYNQNGIDHFIAFAFPGFCKRNNGTVLRTFFNKTGTNQCIWKDFGQEYFDSLGYQCLLSRISYFAATSSGYFESAKRDYCMPHVTTTQDHSNVLYWRQTPKNTRIYQKEFCADKDLRVPSLKCNNQAVLENDFGFDLRCANHTLSNLTQYLYDSVVACKELETKLYTRLASKSKKYDFNAKNFAEGIDLVFCVWKTAKKALHIPTIPTIAELTGLVTTYVEKVDTLSVLN
ncbi:hypothetical protein Trydic_g12485 [Trypoxylus dichotomus]